MKNESKNGIYFLEKTTFNCSSPMRYKKLNQVIYQLLQFGILWIMIYGSLYMLFDSMEFVHDPGGLFLRTGVMLVPFFLLFRRSLPVKFLFPIILVAAAGLIYIYRADLREGWEALLMRGSDLIVNYYSGIELPIYWQNEFNEAFIWLVIAIFSLWMTAFSVGFKRIAPALFPGLLLFVLPLLVGIIPAAPGVLCSGCGTFGLVAISYGERRFHKYGTEDRLLHHFFIRKNTAVISRMHIKIIVAMFIFGVGVFGVSQLLTVRMAVTQEQLMIQKEKITAIYDQFWEKSVSVQGNILSGTSSGGISGGDLAQAGNLSYNGTNQLEVIVDFKPTESIYLKGFVGDNYTGSQWNGYSNGTFDEFWVDWGGSRQEVALALMNLASEAFLNEMQSQIQITEMASQGQYSLMPYSAWLDLYYQTINDRYAYNQQAINVYNYGRYFYLFTEDLQNFPVLGRLSESFTIMESDYRDYVYNYDRILPDTGMEAFKAAYNAATLSAAGISQDSLQDIVNYVKQDLAGIKYTLTPGSTPAGWDFAEYFLFENQRGYCMHFATAATLMFRAFGVPARYVEGYVVTPEDFKMVSESKYQAMVKDYRAHAWTEIYLDGFGWVPVEVTPGYSSGEDGQNTPASPERIETEESEPSETQSTAAPVEEDKNNPQTAATNPVAPVRTNANIEFLKSVGQFFLYILLAAAGVGLIALCLIGRRQIVLRYHYRRIGQKDLNTSVKVMFAQAGQMLNFAGVRSRDYESENDYVYAVELIYLLDKGVFANFIRLAGKAAYSQNGISRVDYMQAYTLFEQLRRKIYEQQSRPKQFIFKYIKCL